MTTHSPAVPATGRATLTDRYVHAATRQLPEDQRADVADELRASIADRVDSLQASGALTGAELTRAGLTGEQAEYAALVELGDPDRMAAGYTGKRLQLIGPELYPAYARVMKGVLVSVVPVVTVVIAVIKALEGESVGPIIGNASWVALNVALQITFWITLTFALVERGSTSEKMQESLGVEWTPDKLPDLPHGGPGSLGETVASVVWPAFMGAAIVWQQFRSPIHASPSPSHASPSHASPIDGRLQDGGEGLPLLDPDLWSFWLPLILVLLAVEMGFEVVKYFAGSWTPLLASVNTVLAAAFAAPVIFLAASDRLLNPAAVAEIQDGWSGFDPVVTNTVIVVTAALIWVWDSIHGWRKAWLAQHAG